MAQKKVTPLIQQYFEIKQEYPDAVLLFQVGDFYELFFDDAQHVSQFLGIALTKRGKHENMDIPLCGFPVHALDHHVPRLVKGGFKVAICQQLEEAIAGKTVRRGVTQVLTPGTLTSDNLLDAKSPSFLCSFFPTQDSYGLLFSELLSSQMYATMLPKNMDRSLEAELQRFLPDEVLLHEQRGMAQFKDFFQTRGFFTTMFQPGYNIVDDDAVRMWMQNQFDESTQQMLQKYDATQKAVALWHAYMKKTQQAALSQVSSIQWYDPEEFLQLDRATLKNLDIVKNSYDGSRNHTLLDFVDRCTTPMGSRTVKRWLLRPVMHEETIYQRQDIIALLVQNPDLLQQVKQLLHSCGDMQRIVGRIALYRAGIKDYVALGAILGILPELAHVLVAYSEKHHVHELLQSIVHFKDLHTLLINACNDAYEKDWLIKEGYNQELDRLRDLVENSSQKIIALERQEQKRAGISSLKIRQNNVHGYYIEVTKANTHLVPDDYVRQQTLVARERYTMPGLQILQTEIMQAQARVSSFEKELFEEVKEQVRTCVTALRVCAQALGNFDALVGLADCAYAHGYVRPEFHKHQDIIIKQGRHPIVAGQLQRAFIPNDTELTDEQSLWIVTGPNMGGKSTYLRQVALICLLGQIGSFVPAASAKLPILDRIFTRIGAGDHLAEGKSTFLVEMEETAQICLQATHKSLVILDEVGRGTSTFDGLALAQAVVEYMHNQVKARCLFATHYHELTHLQDVHPGIVSYYADSKKTATGIVFLHKMVRGVASGSFGLEVARLAKLPMPVIARADDILQTLSHKEAHNTQMTFLPAQVQLKKIYPDDYQDLQRTVVQHEQLLQLFKNIDFNELSPKQAFDLVWSIKEYL